MTQLQPGMARIRVKDLRVRTYIGIKEEEILNKQDVLINLTILYPSQEAVQVNDIEHALNYRTITKAIIAHVEENRFALLERLTKTEKLDESFRDKSYVAFNDAVRGTLWTFTLAGHPAHPSVVCRRPVEEGGKVRLEMSVQCNATDAECEKLVRGFEDLNEQMLKELEK